MTKALPATVVITILFLAFAAPSSAQVLITRQDVQHDVSPPLRDLAKLPRPPQAAPHEAEPLRFIPLPDGFKPPEVPDPVLQRTVTSAPEDLAPTVINNFDGIGQDTPPGFSVCCAPPDTNGAVGLNQYVQWVNLSFAVFDKNTTNMILGPLDGNTLWTGFGGPCESTDDGDPMVVYDKLADRWVLSQFSVRGGNGTFLQCVAVSTTSDATGTYNRYAFTYSNFDDYPKMGVWPDAYYVTFNMFGSVSFLGADACAYDRNAMLNGQPATQVCFQQGPSVGGLLPADIDGRNAPPAGSPNFMMTFGANSLNLYKFHVDFATPANSTFTGPTNIPVAPFTPLCGNQRGCVPQNGDGTTLDSLGDRLMHRLAYRNFGDHESLVVNHAVSVNSGSGVRWYEIQNPNGTPTVAQQSTFAPDGSFRWMGSIAMDATGDVALGYSVSSSSTFPSIAFAGRLASDPASTLGAETTIISGTGAQLNLLTRWGDYSAMQVDPVDDCTFWYTTEYLKNSGAFNWNTRIANFKFPSCVLPDLTINLTHTGNFTQVQTGAQYTLTVNNIGDKDSQGTVTVTDTLPAKLTATAATGSGWSCTLGSTITCTRSDVVAAQASYPPITLTVNVASDAPGTVTNTATVAGGGEKNTSNDTASDPTTIIQTGPDPAISKVHSGKFIQGQTGTYTITVTNTGLSATSGTVTVTDALPLGLTINTVSGAGWTCLAGPPVSCSRNDSLASNAAYPAITLTVNVANNAPGSAINMATVSGGGDTNPQNNTAKDPTAIIPPPPDLTITKSHTGDFNQGQLSANYTLTVNNIGSGPTIGTVKVVDTLPAGLTINSIIAPGWFCTLNTVTCTRRDILAAGNSYPSITVSVNVSSDAAASVINTATVSGGGEINTDNDTANDPTTIHAAPDLTVTKTHTPTNFAVGQNGTYTITVSNSGHAPTSADVFVTDQLPKNMSLISVTGTGWGCSGVFSVTCTRSDVLAAGSSYPPVTLIVSVNSGGTSVTNSASVSGGGEFNTLNDFVSDNTNVDGPTLTITKSHAGDFTVGQTGTYHITVGNTGQLATSGTVTMSDFLPFGMTAIAISGAGWNCSLPPTQSVACTRSDSLAPGNSYPPITLAVDVISSGATVINTANVSGGGDFLFHSASDTANVTTPILAITKTHTGDFTVGQNGNYTITVTNTGKVTTNGVVSLNDSLPLGMTAVAASGDGWNCQPLPNSFLNCSRSDPLHPGKSYPSLLLTVSVTSGAPGVTNTASVSGGGDTQFHSASDLTNVNGPVLGITMSHPGDFTVGQNGSYVIIVNNTGNLTTSGTVTVNDFLPTGLTATAFSGTGWSCPGLPATFVVTCTKTDSLPAGSAYPSLTLTVSVNGGTPSVTNFASVTGGGDTGFHSVNDNTKVIGPVLDIKLSHDGDFTVGQAGGYVIVVTNNGQAATAGTVTVSDILPFGLTATAISAPGWNCPGLPTSAVTCSRSDSLPPGVNYPAILMTLRVDFGGVTVTNNATVSGGGDLGFHAAFDVTKINGPTMAITKTHNGDFTVGQSGTYTITVSNTGNFATTGTVTALDLIPSGMTPTATSGAGWNCSGSFSVTCTRNDSLAANSSYPPITLTVSVNGGGPVAINSVIVSGGGDFLNHFGSDSTNILSPVLAITKTHTGDFTAGQQGTYTITVSNMGPIATSGSVLVTDFIPQGISGNTMSGTGWNCSTFSGSANCTRSDSLAANSSYPPITFTVNVGLAAGPRVTNQATVTGGGDAVGHNAFDTANINAPAFAFAMSHTGNFTVGQTGSYTITASNVGTAATVGGTTVNDHMPPGLTVTAVNAAGWNCFAVPAVNMSCFRGDSLATNSSYPPITLTVSVDPSAQSLVINQATLNNAGEGITHTANDPTLINLPDLAITETHTGTFTVGLPGTYTITVTNVASTATAGGVINVVDFIPSSMTATSASGQDWNCSILQQNTPVEVSCARSAGVLAQGSSYPPIALNVNVAPDAPSSVTNVAGVFGIGDADFSNNFTLDNTTISGLRFVPVAPCRVADTRNPNGPFGGPFLGGGTTRPFPIPSSTCSIPQTAQAYSLNATVVPKGSLGFLTIFPCGQSLPPTSTLNSTDGRVKASATITPAGDGKAVCAFASNDTELVLDINGYFVQANDPSGIEFYPVTPCRLVDTRGPVAPLGGPSLVGNATRSFPILSSSCTVPATAQAYSLNFTSVPKGALGFLTTWPTGQPQPLVSTLNAPTGAVTANAAIVPAGTNGAVSVVASNDSDLVIDINGYFAPPAAGGLSFFPMTPCRALDTRNPAGSTTFNGTLNVDIAGSSPCVISPTAQALVLNATVVPPGPLSFLTLWPQGMPQPLVSTLNAGDGAVTSNLAIVPTTNGSVSAFVSQPSHLILDISGFFAP